MAELKSQDVTPASITDSLSADRDESRGTDVLSHLTKMSGTGTTFGAADYVAINSTAVASLILGFAGALALLLSLFLFLPVIGIICGLLALRQIRHSNGTQGGYAFAIGGILISLVFGGIVGVRETRDWLTVRAQTEQVAAVVARFGDEIKAGHYDNAYDGLTNAAFRARISPTAFRNTLEELQNTPGLGPIQSTEWNHLPMLFEKLRDGSIRASFLTKVQFRDLKESSREILQASNEDGAWKISEIPRIFPEKKKSPRI